MRTKRYLSLLLLFSWLGLSSEAAAAPVVRQIASEQALPESNDLQQLFSSDTDSQPQSLRKLDQVQPYKIPEAKVPNARVKPREQHCKSLEVIAASCEPAPGSPLSAFPVVLNA